MGRVKTWIPKLDTLMEGGIPKKNIVLVTGQAGTGKTILGLQYLVEGAKRGEKGVLISLEQRKEEIFYQAKRFGWDLEKLEKKGLLKILTFVISEHKHVEELFKELTEICNKFKPRRLVLDSISAFGVWAEFRIGLEFLQTIGFKEPKDAAYLPSGEAITRGAIVEIMGRLKSFGLTALVISELPETSNYLSRDTVSEFVADGIIVLQYTGVAGESGNALQIRKMRGSGHVKDYIPFIIKNRKGIVLQTDKATGTLLR